jgi:2-polyprenyl-6-hydroxyphenyl methylase/3-demethylubiquinone-9 3-methyltransferase
LLDVGCGHGVLIALLAVGHPARQVVGIDPDARKIEWARRSVGRCANVELRACTIETLAAERPHTFDTVLVADVLYLLEPAAWAPFLRAAHRLLKPGGRLVLKEGENDGSWRVTQALLQRRVMVHLFRRTQSGSVGLTAAGAALRARTGRVRRRRVIIFARHFLFTSVTAVPLTNHPARCCLLFDTSR